MAVSVVDALEGVEVHQQQSERPLLAALQRKQAAEVLGEHAPVGQAGKAVGVSHVLELLLTLLQLDGLLLEFCGAQGDLALQLALLAPHIGCRKQKDAEETKQQPSLRRPECETRPSGTRWEAPGYGCGARATRLHHGLNRAAAASTGPGGRLV